MQSKGSCLILYDKSGVFLGMGNQELYLLGYEDMEEFRNYHNDFADLFVNKPGYIFKFQNFSWIDYTLHSGTPNKKVLIKSKNGKELETSLTINEIFLNQEINGSNICFCIELNASSLKKELSISSKSDIFEPAQEEPQSFTPQITAITQDTSSEHSENIFQESLLYNDDYTPSFEHEAKDEGSDFKMIVNEVPVLEANMGIKLKFDNDILTPPPQTYSSIDEIKIDDLDFVASLERYPDDKHEDLLNDTNLSVNNDNIKSMNSEFDLAAIADDLGLDINMLAQILGEFIEEIDIKMPLIKTCIDQGNFSKAQNETAKLKSVAHHLRIINLCKQFISLEEKLTQQDLEKSIQDFLNLQKIISSFKETIQ